MKRLPIMVCGLLLCLFLGVTLMHPGTPGTASATGWNTKKTDTYKNKNFVFYSHPSMNKKSVWIYKVDVRGTGKKTLVFPSKIGGASVTRLGYIPRKASDEWGYNIFKSDVEMWQDPGEMVFGSEGEETITKVVIPASVKSLTDCCFSGMSGLKTVVISAGIKSLPAYAFCECDRLANVIMSDGKIKINASAFLNCNMLTNLNIQSYRETFYTYKGLLLDKSKTKIIRMQQNLKKVNIPATITTIPSDCFTVSHAIDFKVSKSNRTFGVAGGVLYNKTTGEYVAGVVKKGTLTIPSQVTTLGTSGSLAGKTVKKLIIQNGAIKLKTGWYESGLYGGIDVKIYFKSKTPPASSGAGMVPANTTLYVPKGAESVYQAWINKDTENREYCNVYRIQRK